MAVTTSSSFSKLLWPGLNKIYGQKYDEYAVEWDKLFDKNTSKRAYEEDLGYSGFGLAQVKTEGGAISYDSERQGFTSRYNHVVYALGFIITREVYEDELYDVVGKNKAQGLAFSMRQTKEINGANVYNRAFTAGYTGGDGSVLIGSSHPNIAGGTGSNVLATASDLSEAALEQAVIDISLLTNDRGLLIALRPKQLIIPPQLQFEATRILDNDDRPGTADRDINAIRQMGMFQNGVTVNHFLTDPDAWFIRTTAQDGMKYFERWADKFEMDNDFDTDNAKYKASARYSFGWTDWRGVYGSAGA